MGKRTKRGQKVHDQKVAQWAKQLRGPSKTVLADLPGHKKPRSIGGKIPDVMVIQGKKVKIVGEVETPGSVKGDSAQQKVLQEGAKARGANFKLKIAKEKRKSK